MKLKNYLTKNPKKHIIFDFDGVIFTLDWHHGENLADYRHRLWSMMEEFDSTLIDRSAGRGTIASYYLTDIAIKKHGQIAKDKIFKFYEDKEKTLIHTAKPHRDVIDFIKENHDTYTYHVWSNNVTNTLLEVLKSENLVDYFETIVGRDQVDFAKPDIGGFDKIFNPTLHNKSDFVMTGDFETDEMAANNAGIGFVYYP